MTPIRLDVPTAAQEKDYCCWHTGAYMIWLYWQGQSGRQGPMNTVASSYEAADTSGLDYGQFITLAQKVGLNYIKVKNQHSEDDLARYLENYGPVWSCGTWFGPDHVIVLTGVAPGKVYFNDPDGGVKREGTVKWFNEKLYTQCRGCLMVKDKDAY
ncbi:MAG: hypothetical protein H7276_15690 [Caulobacter sp.]|nr:hypothetical protein [Vitreoscilla sp.]